MINLISFQRLAIFEARTTTTTVFKELYGMDGICKLCMMGQQIEHFILECPVYSDIRIASIILQSSHIENKQEVISDSLFNEDTII